MEPIASVTSLERSVSTPLLTLYGVGPTPGGGVAGLYALCTFLIASMPAGFTVFSLHSIATS